MLCSYFLVLFGICFLFLGVLFFRVFCIVFVFLDFGLFSICF